MSSPVSAEHHRPVPPAFDGDAATLGTTADEPAPAVTATEAGAAEAKRDSDKPVTAHVREAISTTVELAGIVVLSARFWLLRPWCGLTALGVGSIALGIASSPRFDQHEPSR